MRCCCDASRSDPLRLRPTFFCLFVSGVFAVKRVTQRALPAQHKMRTLVARLSTKALEQGSGGRVQQRGARHCFTHSNQIASRASPHLLCARYPAADRVIQSFRAVSRSCLRNCSWALLVYSQPIAVVVNSSLARVTFPRQFRRVCCSSWKLALRNPLR